MDCRKKLCSLMAIMLLAGCSGSSTAETETETAAAEGLKILSPTGAPALSLLPIVTGGLNEVSTVEGAELLQAAFVNPEPEYDVIIAPTNLGVKLAAAEKTDYRLLAIVTWGNLYIVGSSEEDLTSDHTVAAFGEQAVPGLVFKKVYSDIEADVDFAYSSAQESMAALLSGNADAALIAEPAATAAIAKGKEAGKEFKIISDVQEEWGEEGYPMAAVFVRSDTYEEKKAMYEDLLSQMDAFASGVDMSDTSALVEALNAAGIETFGVPSAEIIGKCWDRLNIHITKAADVKEEIAEFLEIFGVTDIDSAFAE